MDKHLAYPNQGQGEKLPIEVTEMERGQSWEESPQVNKIMFLLKGNLSFSSGEVLNFNLKQGHMLFLRAGKKVTLVSNKKQTVILIVGAFDKILLRDIYMPKKLSEQMDNISDDSEQEPYLLKIIPVIKNFLSLLTECHKAGLDYGDYNELKIRELIYMLQVFYPQEEFLRFFRSVLSPDLNFSQFIQANYSKYKNVADMASAMNYTVSGFEKKFKKVFNEAPYRWMLKQRAQDVYHCIVSGEMNFKEISDMFGFSSVSALNNFVKQKFGKTPGEIRRDSSLGGN